VSNEFYSPHFFKARKELHLIGLESSSADRAPCSVAGSDCFTSDASGNRKSSTEIR